MHGCTVSRVTSLAALFRARRGAVQKDPRRADRSSRSGHIASPRARATPPRDCSTRARTSGTVRWCAVAPATLRRRPNLRERDGDAAGAENAARPIRRPAAYVGDGSEVGKESIIVAGDGEAVVLVDEEEKIREMGWNVAMSKPTLVQLATCAQRNLLKSSANC